PKSSIGMNHVGHHPIFERNGRYPGKCRRPSTTLRDPVANNFFDSFNATAPRRRDFLPYWASIANLIDMLSDLLWEVLAELKWPTKFKFRGFRAQFRRAVALGAAENRRSVSRSSRDRSRGGLVNPCG
ncbi:MAG: hypothetical protein ACRD3O_13780, partial [Terriglobia bacterium]